MQLVREYTLFGTQNGQQGLMVCDQGELAPKQVWVEFLNPKPGPRLPF